MVEVVKQSMANVWASAGDVVMPDVAKIQQGWLVEVPPRQYWNWMQNRTDTNLSYIFQRGIPEWDATVEYQNNKSFVAYNGSVYQSIQTGTNKQPDTETTFWKKAFAQYTTALNAIGGVTPAADRYVYFTSASAATTGTITTFARSILDDVDAAAVRTTIGAQQSDATLTAIAGLTTNTNKLPYFTGVDTAALTDLTTFGRSLIDDVDAATARTTLGLASGATTTVGTIATQNSNSVNITGGSVVGITDLAIADGGTGASNAAGARTNLGLGTASTATVTTSATDTTTNRILKVGDFGVGIGVSLGVVDADTVVNPGGYWVGGSSTNIPLAADGSLTVEGMAARQTQVYTDWSNARRFFRTRTVSSGSWSNWGELWHSLNFNPSVKADINNAAFTGSFSVGRALLISNLADGIEVGRQDGVAGTAYVDLHAGATVTDYDARLQCTSGNGIVGQGTVSLTGGTIDLQSITGATTLRYAGGTRLITTSGGVIVQGDLDVSGIISNNGVVDASEAAAGKIGEVITATRTTAVSQSDNVARTVTQITLTPGDWDVHGFVQFAGTSPDTVFKMACVGLDSATIDTNYLTTIMQTSTNTSIVNHQMVSPVRRVNVTANTIVYLVSNAGFSTGTQTVKGRIYARRVR